MYSADSTSKRVRRPSAAAPKAPALSADAAAPLNLWQGHFQISEPLPEVQRPGLVRQVLESGARWISISGLPGMGRTTLLGQLATELSERGENFRAIWTARRASSAYDFFVYQQAGDLRPLTRWLRQQATLGASRRFTLIVDDYDQLSSERYVALLAELFDEVPGLRCITTTVDPLELDARFGGHAPGFLEHVPGSRLLLDYDELRDFAELATAPMPGRAIGGAPGAPGSAGTRLSEAEIRTVFEATRGIPLGASLAIDRLLGSQPLNEHSLSRLMQSVYGYMLHPYSASSVPPHRSRLTSTFSLMPRFTHRHIVSCFPDAAPEAIEALLSSAALDPRRQQRPGEYVWREEYWHAAQEWNASRFAERRELATRLYRHNEAGEAFEQWFLAGDLARAEAMLRTRFLTVFETLSPETAREVHLIQPGELLAFPMIRVLQLLLDPWAQVQDLRQCTQNLALLGAKGGPTGLLAAAVRAAVLSRKGLTMAARLQAEQVLREAAAEFIEDDEDTEAELRTFSEASLTAALVLFACRTFPRDLASLPRSYGSAFLGYRRELAQQVLERARRTRERSEALPASPGSFGYRSLVFSAEECVREAAAFDAYDRVFAAELGGAGSPLPRVGERPADAPTAGAPTAGAPLGTSPHGAPPPVPHLLSPYADCFERMMAGDLSGAIDTAHQSDLGSPSAALLGGLLMLASGRPQDALQDLETVEDGWGERIAALQAVLRAAAQLRRGRPESARAVLSNAAPLSDVALAQALALLRSSDVDALAELSPRVAALSAAARAAGALGTGRTMAEVREYQALTEKERLVLGGLRDGLNTRQIADKHFLSVNTVRTHVRSIGKKLSASGQAEMLRRAEELRLFSRPRGAAASDAARVATGVS